MPQEVKKKRGNPNWTKKKVETKEEPKKVENEVIEKHSNKKHPLVGKVVYRADGNKTIDGFTFTPFCTVSDDEIIMRGGKEYNAVDFLENRSKWYGKIFWRVGDPDMPRFGGEKPKVVFTKEELLRLASEQNIEVNPNWNELELYMKIFGAEFATE